MPPFFPSTNNSVTYSFRLSVPNLPENNYFKRKRWHYKNQALERKLCTQGIFLYYVSKNDENKIYRSKENAALLFNNRRVYSNVCFITKM